MANPGSSGGVLCYAHQGGAKEAPSSTLFAIARAVALGADAVELDVHRSADGVLVVCHDATLERTTNGSGKVAETSVAALRRLDAAYAFVPGAGAVAGRAADAYRYRGRAPSQPEFSVATLDEVLDCCADVFVNLDIKDGAPAVTPYEEDLARVLRRHQRGDDVIVTSFFDRRTEAFSAARPRDSRPRTGRSMLTAFVQAVREPLAEPLLAAMRHHVALQVPGAIGGITVVDERLVAAAHEHQLAVHVWTIDEPDEMARLIDLGVDGVMTDLPGVLVDVLNERGVRYRR